MSNTINIHMNQKPFTEIQTKSAIHNNQNPQLKVVGFEKERIKPNVEVDISKESKLKQENSSQNTKKAGVTGPREDWENGSAELRRAARGQSKTRASKFNPLESMRIDEPETYAKSMELTQRAGEMQQKWMAFGAEAPTEEELEEYQRLRDESCRIDMDWFRRRCMATGTFQDPAENRYATLNTLESMYSSEGHETSFNFYGTEGAEYRNSLWRFYSKFNVLLSANMVKDLDNLNHYSKLADEDKNKISKLLEKISEAVANMKDVEKAYEGNLEQLAFGVKLWDNGDVTYHANYKDCEDKDGIMANSAEELLQMLMEKK